MISINLPQQLHLHSSSQGYAAHQEYYSDEIRLTSSHPKKNRIVKSVKSYQPSIKKSGMKKRARRNCKIDGCTRAVKAQGLCQGHGARTKLCRSFGCQKQAQGCSDGYCKFHFKNQELIVTSCFDCLPDGPNAAASCSSPITVVTDVTMYSHPSYSEGSYIHDNMDEQEPEVVASTPSFVGRLPQSVCSGWYQDCQPLSHYDAPIDDTPIPLEQWETHLVSNKGMLLYEEDILSPIVDESYSWGQQTMGRLRAYHTTNNNINDYQLEMSLVTSGNKTMWDDEISLESIDAGYAVFQSECRKRIHETSLKPSWNALDISSLSIFM